MLGRDVYAVGTLDKFNNWTTIAELGKLLNKDEFLPKGYFVDEEIHNKKPRSTMTLGTTKRRRKYLGYAGVSAKSRAVAWKK